MLGCGISGIRSRNRQGLAPVAACGVVTHYMVGPAVIDGPTQFRGEGAISLPFSFQRKLGKMESIIVSSREVEELANMVMTTLAQSDATNGLSICACAVTVGRLMAPRTISSEEEMKFMQDLVEWVGLYWSGLDTRSN